MASQTFGGVGRPDPTSVTTRAELGGALRRLRESSGMSVRELVEQSDGYLGTISGWLSGAHAPTAANRELFNRVLNSCGVPDEEISEWWAAVTRARVRTRAKSVDEKSGPPYRGFESYQIRDAADFFGREDVSETLLNRIDEIASGARPPVPLIVVGGSGIGKSSVVRAGLARRFAAPDRAGWDQLVVTPGVDPGETIDAALAALRSRGAPHPVLVVDQFEEVWTQADGGADFATEIAARLMAVADGERPRPVVILALRSDFLDRLVSEPGYAAAASDGTVVVGPIGRDGMHAAVAGPAERRGLAIEPGLMELLLGDAAAAGDSTGVLPLLSHALLGTWDASENGRMTVVGYLGTGRLTGAVEKSAEAVYADLTELDRTAMHDLLLGLINVEENRVTRRITSPEDLGLTEGDESAAGKARVLDRLLTARLLTISDDGVQLDHEALVDAWPRLRRWVEANRNRLRLEHRIRVAAALWSQSGDDEALLLSPGALDLIDSFDTPETPVRWGATERRMIALSTERRDSAAVHDRRQARRFRAAALIAGALALVALLTAGAAAVGLSNTARARDAAAQAHAESLSRQLALESRRLRARDSALAAQLAVAAYRISATVEARSNLLDTLSDPLSSRRNIEGSYEVAASPSGTIAAIRKPGRVELYNVDDHGLKDLVGGVDIFSGELPGSGLEFTPDGAALVVGTGKGVVEVDVRDVAAPRVTATVDTGKPVARLSMSNDGAMVLASLADSAPVLLRRADRWRATAFPAGDYAESQAGVALSGDARLAAVSAPGKGIALWDVSGPVPMLRGTFPLDGASNQAIRMAFRGQSLAAGLRSRDAVILNISDPAAPTLSRTIGGFTSYVNDVEYSADGSRLTAASSDGQVKIASLTDGTPDLVFNGPEPIGVATVAGGTVLAAADGGVLRTWPMRAGGVALGERAVFQIPVHGSEILVANGGPDSAVGQWHAAPGPALVRSGPDIPAPAGDLFSGALALSPTGTTGVLGTANGRVFLADLRDRARPSLSPVGAQAMGSIVEVVSVSPDGRTALVGGLSTPRVSVLDISDAAAPRVVGGFDVPGGVPWLAFLPGDLAVIGSASGDLLLVDLKDRAAPKVLRTTHIFDTTIAAVAASPDGRTLLLAASGGATLAQVTGVAPDGEPAIVRFSGPSGSVNGAAFSPDGTRLVVASSSGEARLYRLRDSAAPEREASLTVDGAILFDARFTGDGTMTLASGNSGRLRAWDLNPQNVIDAVCSSRSAPITEDEWSRLVPGEPYRNPCD